MEDGADASFGYAVDAGAQCNYGGTRPTGADAEVEGTSVGAEQSAILLMCGSTSPLPPSGIVSTGVPVPASTGVTAPLGPVDATPRVQAEGGSDLDGFGKRGAPEEQAAQSQVAFQDPFLQSSGEAQASTAGASGRVVILGAQAAFLSLGRAEEAPELSPDAPRASGPSPVVFRSPASQGADEGAWTLEGMGARASRGFGEALRPLLPAAAAFVPAPTQVGGKGGPGPLGSLDEAQLAGLAAAGLVPAALAALYQRFTASASMQHERRAAIHKALAAWPQGATAGEVARALGMKRKTVEYHLHYCAKAGIVRVGQGPDGARRYSLGALPQRPGVTERLLALIRERPGLSTAELAGQLGVPRDGVDRRVKEFAIQGVVECRLVDGERRMYPGAA